MSVKDSGRRSLLMTMLEKATEDKHSFTLERTALSKGDKTNTHIPTRHSKWRNELGTPQGSKNYQEPSQDLRSLYALLITRTGSSATWARSYNGTYQGLNMTAGATGSFIP